MWIKESLQVSDKVILEKLDLSAETTRKPYSAECVYEKVVHVIFPTEHSRLESQQDRESQAVQEWVLFRGNVKARDRRGWYRCPVTSSASCLRPVCSLSLLQLSCHLSRPHLSHLSQNPSCDSVVHRNYRISYMCTHVCMQAPQYFMYRKCLYKRKEADWPYSKHAVNIVPDSPSEHWGIDIFVHCHCIVSKIVSNVKFLIN